MSDETRPPTAAEEAKTEAEAAKLRAETLAAEATARKTIAEAEAAEHDAATKAIELHKAREAEAARVQSDDHCRYYDFDSDVSASSVAKCMAALRRWHRIDPGCDIEIVFNSPGGSVIDGFALFDQILAVRAAGHKVTTGVLGEAASMAGVLVQAGEYRWAGSQSWYLIHRAAFGAMGKTFTVEDQVQWVKRIEKRIIDVFVSRSHLTAAKITRNWERKDWWLDADQCLELALVDEIR